MFKKSLLLLFITSLAGSFAAKADEGMWMIALIKKLNETDMQNEGLKLSADDIYNINHSSLKDAVVRLGGGFCTAEIVSADGLMLTNHHCAFESIQEHSTVDHDYLTNGFWAKNHDQELPNPGLFADFLIRVEDVTDRINSEVSDTLPEAQRAPALQKAYAAIIKESADSNGYKAEVRSFFKSNKFYLFLYQTFRDIRLVGVPPSSIGKFGGDTDNWMWPRHTGDFSLFRVYATKDGKPSDYNKDNVPYKPKYFLPVSLDGIKKDDFTMVMGYPGATDRYLTSEGVKTALEYSNPTVIKIREKKLEIIKHDMDASDAIRIKYSDKYYESSNYYKYYIGQNKGLIRMDVVRKKQEEENKFNQWANADPVRKEKYGSIISNMAKNYEEIRKYTVCRQSFAETVIQGPEILLEAYKCRALNDVLSKPDAKPEEIKAIVDGIRESSKEYFKNYNMPTDIRVFAALLDIYNRQVPAAQHSPLFTEMVKKYDGNFDEYAKEVYKKTIFCDSIKFHEFLQNPSAKKLKKDPGFALMDDIYQFYVSSILPPLRKAEQANSREYRHYIAGLMEMYPDRKFYPDANSTMRLSYGKVEDYKPMDGVYYNYFTTLEGIMEKKDNSNEEFTVPAKLEELYNRKDYGRYGEDGIMHVCFITTNDITGGSSGSPVINGKGELIGLAFDGNWEAMSGDIAFDSNYKRCINVDIRYVLFIIDKYAGASYLVNEMKLTREPKADTSTVPSQN
jgi:hypothetical protein